MGKTVQEVKELPFEEYQGWVEYFLRRPFGWQEDLRTYYIMRAFGTKDSAEQIFPSLATLKREQKKSESKSVFQSSVFQGNNIISKMLNAKGGDQLEILKELQQ